MSGPSYKISFTGSPYILCADCKKEVARRSSAHLYCRACMTRRRHRARTIANLKRRKKKLGRECKWCGDTDSDDDRDWSARNDECGACSRQRLRSSCFWCGGPFYITHRVSTRGHGVGCIQYCEDVVEIERRERRRIRLLEETG